MVIQTLLTSIVITLLPVGADIPNTMLRCGKIAGVYNTESKIVYLCQGVPGDTEFYKNHEIGHYFYFNILSNIQKDQYHKEYLKAYSEGSGSFFREYGYNSEVEDFADNFAFMIQKKRQPYKIQKRINLIKNYFLKL